MKEDVQNRDRRNDDETQNTIARSGQQFQMYRPGKPETCTLFSSHKSTLIKWVSMKAMTIYARRKTVENPSQIPRNERWGIQMVNIAHTSPAIEIKRGSFIWSSSLNRT